MTDPVTTPRTGKVTQVAPAPCDDAAAYFAAKLRCETDPSDVWHDMQHGTVDFVVVDTRSPDAYRDAHVPGAVNIPHALVDEATTAGLDRSTLVVTYCWGPGCNAGTKGAHNLARLGFRVKEMIGGIEYWSREGYPVEQGA